MPHPPSGPKTQITITVPAAFRPYFEARDKFLACFDAIDQLADDSPETSASDAGTIEKMYEMTIHAQQMSELLNELGLALHRRGDAIPPEQMRSLPSAEAVMLAGMIAENQSYFRLLDRLEKRLAAYLNEPREPPQT
jgi:hypothetical protein